MDKVKYILSIVLNLDQMQYKYYNLFRKILNSLSKLLHTLKKVILKRKKPHFSTRDRTSSLLGVYILRPKSTNTPPPLPVAQTSPKHTFLQKFGAVFGTFRGKFKELGYKIYTPYGFLMLI